ncbi:hypothetical protein DVH24_009971 [Malus domestica]|uniref:Uncharacterized protein n=1 Tax=Malus domestica TaxID=3750 RepID=A0A498JRH8_MALDO|nr:hypothetical protein DVH24_009971 [Malus domestica]
MRTPHSVTPICELWNFHDMEFSKNLWEHGGDKQLQLKTISSKCLTKHKQKKKERGEELTTSSYTILVLVSTQNNSMKKHELFLTNFTKLTLLP